MNVVKGRMKHKIKGLEETSSLILVQWIECIAFSEKGNKPTACVHVKHSKHHLAVGNYKKSSPIRPLP